MNIENIERIFKLFDASSATGFEYQDGEIKLSLKKDAVVHTAEPALPVRREAVAPRPEGKSKSDAADEGKTVVKAPLVGILYGAREPGAYPFVTPGQAVKKGDILCLIEAMKTFNEIKSPCGGIIEEILFSDGDLAEFGMPLFVIGEAP